MNVIAEVKQKYEAAGYVVIIPAKLNGRNINDLIASRDGKYHFVLITSTTTVPDNGTLNIFVQNAISNAAIPVLVKYKTGKTTTYSFIDANTNKTILIRGKNKKMNTNIEESNNGENILQ